MTWSGQAEIPGPDTAGETGTVRYAPSLGASHHSTLRRGRPSDRRAPSDMACVSRNTEP